MEFALQCHDLRKVYSATRQRIAAVDGVTLQVRAGSCFGILGPNGAGKTTLVEILVGLCRPTSGEYSLLDSAAGLARDRVGVALQQMALPPKLTATETLRMFSSFYAAPLEVQPTLEAFDLNEQCNQQIRTLSAGQHQRLAVACALIGDPDLIFLDEPTAGADPISRGQIWKALQTIGRPQRSIVITTHSMEEASQLCDRVAILQRGKVIADGAPTELVSRLLASSRICYRLEGKSAIDVSQLQSLNHVISATVAGKQVSLEVSDVGPAMGELMRYLERRHSKPADLRIEQGSLQEVYLKLIGDEDANA